MSMELCVAVSCVAYEIQAAVIITIVIRARDVDLVSHIVFPFMPTILQRRN